MKYSRPTTSVYLSSWAPCRVLGFTSRLRHSTVNNKRKKFGFKRIVKKEQRVDEDILPYPPPKKTLKLTPHQQNEKGQAKRKTTIQQEN